MKIFKITSYALSLFLICLGISILVKNKFGVDGDYLSAFSTLVAALVAVYLYSDWRVEHRLKLLEQYHNKIKEESYAAYLKVNYILVDHPVLKVKDNDHEELKNQINFYLKDIDKLAEILTELCISVNEYQNFLSTFKKSPLVDEMIAEVDEFHTNLNISFDSCIEILNSFNTLDPSSSENEIKIKFIWDTTLKIKIASAISFSNFYIEYLNKSK
ncbi:hypothetical protein LF296_12880 [Acinetobacter vivianii]|uniref:DUF4760 domain-containing protein n=1 Tax=Acinetobacter vivianii TaxID=1776742 RepID=A0AAJ6P4B7_9GAMM|nr:hypothetical protein [Acinetobacter vivianii]WDZ50215.1 hypothetical protein LF296_12880 [Acinetobacter vivianii]